MTSGGCKSCRNVVNINLSSNTDFPVAKLLIIGGFIVITVGFILFTACWMVYLFFRIYDPIDIATTNTTTITTSSFGSATSSCHDRIDHKVVASAPVFVHSSSSRKEKIECAVCLMEMKNGEKGRLLSRCGHRFHVECIDMWLHSHSTCPLCRSNVGSEFTKVPI